jgi:hypothetical protein
MLYRIVDFLTLFETLWCRGFNELYISALKVLYSELQNYGITFSSSEMSLLAVNGLIYVGM